MVYGVLLYTSTFVNDLLVAFASTLLRTCARHTSWATFKQNDLSLLGLTRHALREDVFLYCENNREIIECPSKEDSR